MTHRQNTQNSHPVIQVHVVRGNLSESVHLVDAIVVDEHGQTVAAFGDGEMAVTYPRSAIKMIQALSFVESEAYAKWNLDQRHLTMACASHNGENTHTELVMEWLEQIQASENDLVCGAHIPFHEATAHSLIRESRAPSRRHNNCSGKHTSMLCTMKTMKIDSKSYGFFDHPLQKRLRQIVSDMSGDDLNRAQWGGDGCGIPTYAMSLRGIAQGLRRFLPDQKNLSTDRFDACRLIREAVIAQPHYIGGTGDFCSEMMAGAAGKLLLKSGAEGVYAGAMLKEGLSFALKVRDGNPRAARAAAVEILHQFQGLSESEFLQLSSHTQPVVKNWEGSNVGKIFVPPGMMS